MSELWYKLPQVFKQIGGKVHVGFLWAMCEQGRLQQEGARLSPKRWQGLGEDSSGTEIEELE